MSGSDTAPIAALATGGGASALAVLRLTGEGVFDRVAPCLDLLHPGPWRARQLRLARFVDPQAGAVLDELLAVRFPGPRSFTGQDLVELHAHGGPYVVRKILETLYAAGFRAAEPGEFTRRAFLAGKLDLTAAEGIGALVGAESHQQWLAARHLVSGKLRDRIEDLRKILVECMAYLEAQIDFPDEGDTAHLHRRHVRERAVKVQAAVERLRATFDSGKVASGGLMVALYGEPNAGKSTLMNELLGHERAIVTDVAGTTRDYLEERCLIDGRLIRLVDMAGVRDATDAVERIGVERALKLAAEADLVLALAPADGTEARTKDLDARLAALAPKRVLKILTKSDRGRPAWAGDRHAISCYTGAGLDELRASLVDAVETHVHSLGAEDAFVTSARHAAALTEAASFLARFFEADADGAFDELLAFELQQAARSLKRIVGDVDVEDVLDAIFTHFCVGK